MSVNNERRLAALQYHDFRLMWGGNFVSVVGSQMQMVAINWHVYRLLAGTTITIDLFGREIALGAEALGLGGVGLARVIPIMVFAIIGGTLADVTNRRKLLIITNGIAALLAAVLAWLSFSQRDTVLAIYLLTAAGSATAAFSSPAQQALIPNLVPKRDLTNAISLNSTMRHVATIGGPALAGLIIGASNESWVYAINAISFAAVIGSLSLLHYSGKVVQRTATGLGWSAIVEGWRFVRGSRIIWSSMMLDFMATFFSSARTMLPLVAGEILKVGAQGYGLLSTAEAVGALAAGTVLSLRKDIHRQGIILLVSVALYGLATALFGLSTSFALSYLLFMFIGGDRHRLHGHSPDHSPEHHAGSTARPHDGHQPGLLCRRPAIGRVGSRHCRLALRRALRHRQRRRRHSGVHNLDRQALSTAAQLHARYHGRG